MSFRVTARTVLQLGAELISSDGVAFYELIKNAFDAQSKRVEIEIVTRVPGDKLRAIRAEMKTAESGSAPRATRTVEVLKERVLDSVDKAAPTFGELVSEIKKCQSLKEVANSLEEVNYIRIKDSGEGMSLDDLNEVYLTIGTRSRLKERMKRQGDPRTNPRSTYPRGPYPFRSRVPEDLQLLDNHNQYRC